MNLIDTAARAASTSLSIGAGVMLVVADHLTSGPAWNTASTAVNPPRPVENGLEARVDRYLSESGMAARFGCTAVVVVEQGKIALKKGYGAMEGASVSPTGSLFTTTSSTNSFRTTAVDLGRFLNSLLEGPGYPFSQARSAYRRRFVQHPDVQDAVYGFYETCEARRRALFHAGSSPDAHSHRTLLYLFPEEELGLVLLLGGGTASDAVATGSGLAHEVLLSHTPA